jgi:hypothetical protein
MVGTRQSGAGNIINFLTLPILVSLVGTNSFQTFLLVGVKLGVAPGTMQQGSRRNYAVVDHPAIHNTASMTDCQAVFCANGRKII